MSIPRSNTNSLVYNGEILQFRTFGDVKETKEVIAQWYKMYGLNKPKKHPVYIHIMRNTNTYEKRKLLKAA